MFGIVSSGLNVKRSLGAGRGAGYAWRYKQDRPGKPVGYSPGTAERGGLREHGDRLQIFNSCKKEKFHV